MRSSADADGLYRLRPGLLRGVPLAVLLILAFAVGLVSLRYLSGDPAALPPSMQASFVANGWIFVAHTTASALALMVGAVQFSALPRRCWPGVHRWAGRSYVLFCAMGAASALWIAPDVESGWVATLGFSALAVAWMAVTAQGWRHAVNLRFDLHRRWMLRSYALTAAAISLRLQLLVFEAFGLDYNQVSALLSLSCWLPNVAAVEAALYLARRRRATA
ncbi:DUF2306 domain-containing protein [Pelagibius litoralis]|uniref:DUF2306 domain-containing protein n=1 Tax=Pelagibius litoralis TaxID=374515 RepID=A0A967F2L3_9PROT|nr:DUF2306 domain-containing protein [Pelagibius litoralis]NIA71755.1 DUF2306 domain-containing protein [Pelagibius litoralis]